MALWQYTFIIVPRNIALQPNSQVDERTYNTTDFWNNKYDVDLFKKFRGILPIAESWSKNIILFGDEDSNRLEIVFEDKKITEVILRIDFRTDYTILLEKFIKFCISNGFVLLDENLNIMPYDLLKIVDAIERSQQFNMFKEMSQTHDL